MPATQHTGQQRGTPADRSVLSARIPGNQRLVPLERFPRDIALMPVLMQYRPVPRIPLPNPAQHALAAVLDYRLALPAPECVGARVDRVAEHQMQATGSRHFPHNPVLEDANRDRDPFAPEPQIHLPNAAQLGELAEHQVDRISLTLVRGHLDATARDLLVARRKIQEQLAAFGHRGQGLHRTLSEHGQLHFTEVPFHAEKKSVVGQGRVVQRRLVTDQTADNDTEIQQRMPVPSVARQS